MAVLARPRPRPRPLTSRCGGPRPRLGGAPRQTSLGSSPSPSSTMSWLCSQSFWPAFFRASRRDAAVALARPRPRTPRGLAWARALPAVFVETVRERLAGCCCCVVATCVHTLAPGPARRQHQPNKAGRKKTGQGRADTDRACSAGRPGRRAAGRQREGSLGSPAGPSRRTCALAPAIAAPAGCCPGCAGSRRRCAAPRARRAGRACPRPCLWNSQRTHVSHPRVRKWSTAKAFAAKRLRTHAGRGGRSGRRSPRPA